MATATVRKRVDTLGGPVTLITGSFATNSTSDPAAASHVGSYATEMWTVAHSGTGYYTITFKPTMYQVVASTAHLQLNTPDGSIATIKSASISAGVLTVVVYTLSESGSAADIAANANNRVNFLVAVRLASPTIT